MERGPPGLTRERHSRAIRAAAMRRGRRDATVYRVSPGPVNTWRIYAGPNCEPVASFGDKSAAVRYAMRLARGEVNWPSLASPPASVPQNQSG
jgi:hypothetical protein